MKKLVINIRSPEAIKIIDNIPKGRRAEIVEAALIAFSRSETGRALLERLRLYVKKRGQKSIKRPTTKEEALEWLKGDF